MRYIAALDYEHLDNGMFLTALARSISQQENTQPIIVHGDSKYTDRIMQTGVMRNEATVRSIKDLNHRLVALFADEGVSTVGINGYQKKIITQKNGNLSIDQSFFDKLPAGPVLLISTLVWDDETAVPKPVPLDELTAFLNSHFKTEALFVFNKEEKDEIFVNQNPGKMKWDNLPGEFKNKHIPEEFTDFKQPMNLTNARDFANLDENDSAIRIR